MGGYIGAVAREACIEDCLGDADFPAAARSGRRVRRRGKEPRRDAAEAVRFLGQCAEGDLAGFEPLRELVARVQARRGWSCVARGGSSPARLKLRPSVSAISRFGSTLATMARVVFSREHGPEAGGTSDAASARDACTAGDQQRARGDECLAPSPARRLPTHPLPILMLWARAAGPVAQQDRERFPKPKVTGSNPVGTAS